MGDKITLIMNGVSAGSMSIPINDRPQLNQWLVYASGKHDKPADADIEELTVELLPQSSSTSVLASYPPIKPLIRDNIIGKIANPPRTDFSISFVIKPHSTYSGWTSILRFTDRQNQSHYHVYGDRSPALFMRPRSLIILVTQSSTKDSNHWFNSNIELNMNQRNNVKLEYEGDQITLIMNGVFAGSMSIPVSDRPQLNQWLVYASGKHDKAADADIEELTVELLPQSSSTSVLASYPPIKPLIKDNIIGTIANPPRTDFSISFVIKPYSTYTSFTSILRFTDRLNQSNHGVYGDRSPALVMRPSSLIICVIQGSTKHSNQFDSNVQLNMNQRNTVKLEYEGDKITLIMNGVSAGSMSIPVNDRPQLNQWLVYVSDKHWKAADADVEELTVELLP